MSSVGGNSESPLLKPATGGKVKKTPTTKPASQETSSNEQGNAANDLTGLQNARASIRSSQESSVQAQTQANDARSVSLSTELQATAQADEASSSANNMQSLAEDKTTEAGTERLNVRKYESLADSKKGNKSVQQHFKQLAEDSKKKSIEAEFEAQKARNEAEIFKEEAEQSQEVANNAGDEADEHKREADDAIANINVSRVRGGEVDARISSTRSTASTPTAKPASRTTTTPTSVSAFRTAGATSSPAARTASGRTASVTNADGSTTGARSSSSSSSGSFLDGVANSPGAGFLAAAEGIREAIAGVVRAGRSKINPSASVAFEMTQKTMAQQGKSTVEAGIAQETNGASNTVFRLRLLDSMFSAITGKSEEAIKYHEERGKQHYITAVKATNDFFKPA